MTTHNTQPHPTLSQLTKATGLALIVAGVILITAVLPAEYDIDPTGSGKMLGLTTLSVSSAPASESAASIPAPRFYRNATQQYDGGRTRCASIPSYRNKERCTFPQRRNVADTSAR